MENANERPWHEQDAFWQAVAPFLFNDERISAASEEIEQLGALLDLQPGAKMCDLCCGIGRHSIELARRGFEVTAVDRTALYLQEAKKKTDAEQLSVRFVQADMRDFCRQNSFDVVVNLFTSFGYFRDPNDDRKVLANIYASLKQGGQLLMELAGKEVLAGIFRERDWRQENGTIMLEERQLTDAWGGVTCRWIMLRDGKMDEYRFSHRLYSAVELRDLVQSCGFSGVRIYGGLDGSPYDDKAKRLVLAARK
jgi:SAM-dependent methyltransferase